VGSFAQPSLRLAPKPYLPFDSGTWRESMIENHFCCACIAIYDY
jgi:hypothetical protein